MPGLTMILEGAQELGVRLGEVMPALAMAAGAVSLYRIGTEIMAVSARECPVETGTLRASGHVDHPVQVGSVTEVTLGYGGAASAYAIFVHERMDLHHNPPTKAKFLEDPVNAAAPRIQAEYGAAVKVALAGGLA